MQKVNKKEQVTSIGIEHEFDKRIRLSKRVTSFEKKSAFQRSGTEMKDVRSLQVGFDAAFLYSRGHIVLCTAVYKNGTFQRSQILCVQNIFPRVRFFMKYAFLYFPG